MTTTGTLEGGQSEVVIAMKRARSLTLRFEDESGAVCTPDWAVLRSADGWGSQREWHPRPSGTRIHKVPVESLEALVRIGTRTLRHSVEVEDDEAILRLPIAGRLLVTLTDRPLPSEDWGDIVVTVTELSLDTSPTTDLAGLEDWILGGYPEGSAEISESYSRDATGTLTLRSALLPGRYAIEVEFRDGQDEGQPGRSLYSTEVRIDAGAEVGLDVPR